MRRGRAAADLERRIHAARLRRAGWSEAEYRLALLAAAQAWAQRAPWRLLPRFIRGRAFGLVGRGFAARYLERWRSTPAAAE